MTYWYPGPYGAHRVREMNFLHSWLNIGWRSTFVDIWALWSSPDFSWFSISCEEGFSKIDNAHFFPNRSLKILLIFWNILKRRFLHGCTACGVAWRTNLLMATQIFIFLQRDKQSHFSIIFYHCIFSYFQILRNLPYFLETFFLSNFSKYQRFCSNHHHLSWTFFPKRIKSAPPFLENLKSTSFSSVLG